MRRGFLGELVLPQLVDKVGTNVVRMDVEVAGLIGFDGSSEKWEVFENVSKGRNEIEDGLLYRMVRLGHRWEVVVDRNPDEGDDEVQSVDLYGVWAGEAEHGGGSHPDRSEDRLRHGVAEGEEREGIQD